MNRTILGFNFTVIIEPTTPTLLRYRNFQSRIKTIRCGLLHDTSWVLKKFKDVDCRFYYCRQCDKTWLDPIK